MENKNNFKAQIYQMSSAMVPSLHANFGIYLAGPSLQVSVATQDHMTWEDLSGPTEVAILLKVHSKKK